MVRLSHPRISRGLGRTSRLLRSSLHSKTALTLRPQPAYRDLADVNLNILA
jgi:hypothetical protein